MSEDNAPDVAAIAARLDADLRALVIRMGDDRLVYGGIATFNIEPHDVVRMRYFGLCRCEHQPGAYSPIDRLTPLGVALRQHLMEKNDVQG